MNERCGNYGGYDVASKTLVCSLDESKVCAGYDRLCPSYIAYYPYKHKRDQND